MMQGIAIKAQGCMRARLGSSREYGEFGEAVLQDDTYRALGNSDKCFPTTTTNAKRISMWESLGRNYTLGGPPHPVIVA